MNRLSNDPFPQDDLPDQEQVPQLDFPPLVDPFASESVSQPDPIPQSQPVTQESKSSAKTEGLKSVSEAPTLASPRFTSGATPQPSRSGGTGSVPDFASQSTPRQGSTPFPASRRPSSPEHPAPVPEPRSSASELEASDTLLLNTSARSGTSASPVADLPTTALPTIQPTPSPLPKVTSSATPPRPEVDLPTVHTTPPSRPEADSPTIPLATVHTAPPPSASKKANKKSGVLVSIVVILALLVASGGTLFALHLRSTVQSKKTPTVQATASPTATPVVSTTGTLNQPLQAGENWVVTVTRVTTTTNSDFPPQTGYTYLEISLSLKNVSATPQMLASLLQFTFTGASGKKYNEAAAITKDTNIQQTPDGTINSGQTLKAQLSYLVPQAQHTFTLSFAYDLIEGGSSTVTWQLNA
jgi:flagellar basal body-associated protein FliL